MSADKDNELDDLNLPPVASPTILAHALIQNLFQFLRQTEVHDPANGIFALCSQEILRVLKGIFSLPGQSGVELHIRGETIFFNKVALRPKPRQFHVYRYFVRFCRARRIGGIRLFTYPSLDRLITFLWTVTRMKPEEMSVAELNRYFKAQGIQEFEVDPPAQALQKASDVMNLTEIEDIELAISVLYKNIHRFIETCLDNPTNVKQFQLQPIQQLLHELMLMGEDDIIQMLRLISIKRYDRPLPYRAVNSCFMMIAWGRALRLPEGVVSELAGAALAHVISEACQFSKEKISVMLDQLSESWFLTDLQKLGMFEWWIPQSESGVYEVDKTKCYLHFFSRMVRIVSTFERLTTFEPGKRVYLPDEAVGEMLKLKKDIDPTLTKLFVNWLGVYPVGCLVQLQTGEIAQVFAGASDPLRFQRPIVSLIKDANGQILDRPVLVDLAEMNEKLGIYKKSIRRSLALEESKIPSAILKLSPVTW